MSKVPLKLHNNTLKGKFKPPRYRVFAEDNGVVFTRTFRTMKGVVALKQKKGITNFNVVTLN